MARPRSVPYDEIMAKYQTGQYSISKLAKEYNVGKSRLSEYINKNNVRVSEQAIHTINTLNSGFSALQKMVSEQVSERPKETQNTELIEYQSNNTLIVNEVIEIVKKKNPLFNVFIVCIACSETLTLFLLIYSLKRDFPTLYSFANFDIEYCPV